MKRVALILMALVTLLSTAPVAVEARDGRFGGRGGAAEFRGRPGVFRDGFRGGGFRGGHHLHGGSHFSTSIWFGPVWDPWWPGYYPVPYPGYYYSEPRVIIEQQEPQQFIVQPPSEDAPVYWYYCEEPKGYYPYVKRCNSDWLKVTPTPPPDAE